MSEVLTAIARHAAEDPDRMALLGPRPMTYQDLQAAIDIAAESLDRLVGARPVAIALDNGPAWVVADLALLRTGTPVLPLPPFFTAEQRRHAIEDAGAALVLAADGPGHDIFLGGQPVVACVTGAEPRRLHHGTAKVTYTSGSTGAPKGVCLSLAQMEAVAGSLVERLGSGQAGIHLPLLPLGVLLENVAGLYATLLAGGAYHAAALADVGLAAPFQPNFAIMATQVARTRATSLILVPELLRGVLAAQQALALEFSDLTLAAVGGAKVSPTLHAAAHAAGVPVREGYGMTECASVVALNTPSSTRAGSVGRVLPHLDVSVSDDGELIIERPGFLGYVGAEPHRGPFRTGDLGEIDGDGFLRITGRRTNLIINAFGRNISPEWVESELLARPQIAQAVVYGEAAAELGALIVPSDAALTPEAIQAAVMEANAALPPYAQIAHWRLAAPFDPARGELTGNGRPRRDVLLDRHLQPSREFQ